MSNNVLISAGFSCPKQSYKFNFSIFGTQKLTVISKDKQLELSTKIRQTTEKIKTKKQKTPYQDLKDNRITVNYQNKNY